MPNQRKRKSSCLGDLLALPFRLIFLIVKLPFIAIAGIVRLPLLALRSAVPTKNRRRGTSSKPNFTISSTLQRSSRSSGSPRPIAMKKPVSIPAAAPVPRNTQSILDYLYFELSPTQFEFEVARMLKAHGFIDVERVGGADDRGVDIKCMDEQGRMIVVQCKQYSPEKNGVGSKDIQNFLGVSTRYHRAHRGIFVTTSRFTKSAKEVAQGSQIRLIDGAELSKLYTPLLAAPPRQQEVSIPIPIRSIPANTTVRVAKMAIVSIFAIVTLGVVIQGYDWITRTAAPTPTQYPTASWTPNPSPTATPAKVAVLAPTFAPISTVSPSPTSQTDRLESLSQAQDQRFEFGQSVSLKSAAMLYEEPGVPGAVVAILNYDSPVNIIGNSIHDSTGEIWWPVIESKTGRTGFLRDGVLIHSSNSEESQVVPVQDLSDPAHSLGTFRETQFGQRFVSTPSS